MIEIKRPVLVCGENPAIRLFDEAGERVAALSYWHCTWSPYGAGHALVLWLRDAPGRSGIYADNAPLAELLVMRLTRHFPELQSLDIAALPRIPAQLQHTSDGRSFYEAVCAPETGERITARWDGLLDVKLVAWPGYPTGDITHDLTTVICPCRAASITLGVTPVAGRLRTDQEEGYPTSSAFLAFSETWVAQAEL
jgi:hypothetical protein